MKRYKPGPVWFFDLDNTLHDASSAIFPAIAVNMNAFIASVLEREAAPHAHDVATAANAARLHYTRRYGAALLGMVLHHRVRAADFLHAAHRFDDLSSMIRAERGLVRLLAALPGRKVLLTNAPRSYSNAVMRHLKLHRHFADHVAIESMTVFRNLRPKPARSLLRKMAARERVAPSRCILVEDTVPNLKAARAVGMRTAWVTGFLPAPAGVPNLLRKRPGYVDVKMKSLRGLRRFGTTLAA